MSGMSSPNQLSLKKPMEMTFRFDFKENAMFFALLGIWAIFFVWSGFMFSWDMNTNFISPRNITNLVLQNSFIFILAIGMVFVIVAGHIDLSVGFLGAWCGAVSAILQAQFHVPDVIAMAAAVVLGALFGAWQGLWIAFFRLPAFIVTLAGMLITKGLLLVTLSGGQTITLVGDSYKQLASGYIPDISGVQFDPSKAGLNTNLTAIVILAVAIVALFFVMLKNRSSRIKYGFPVYKMGTQVGIFVAAAVILTVFSGFFIMYAGIPYIFLLVGALVFLYEFIANKTVFGRHVYAIGGNKEAARLSGINIRQRTFMIFVSMGGLAGLAGVVFTSRLNSASPAAGTLWELDAIAAAIIGGTSTMGGEGKISGAILGALIMGSLNSGMLLVGVPSALQYIVKGLILLAAVLFDLSVRNRKK